MLFMTINCDSVKYHSNCEKCNITGAVNNTVQEMFYKHNTITQGN